MDRMDAAEGGDEETALVVDFCRARSSPRPAVPRIDSDIDKGGVSQRNGCQEHGRQPEHQRLRFQFQPVLERTES